MPGHSTSINERFHRKLNRCMVVGASRIGPQLIVAILSVLFYQHNKSLEGKKHICNSQVVPIEHPIESPNDEETKNLEDMNIIENLHFINDSSISLHCSDDHKKIGILNTICNNIDAHHKTIKELHMRCKNRLVSIYTLIPKEGIAISETAR